MNVIYKYVLANEPAADLLVVPKGSQILKIDVQHNSPTIWLLVDPSQSMESRHFEIVMTGQEFLSNGKEYVGTVQLHGGAFVLHVFEVKSR